MAARPYILALDQGTSSSRAIAFDADGRPVAAAQESFEQRFPSPGHVTHDPAAIWASQLTTARSVIEQVGGPDRIAAIGIANQRETTVVWERDGGRPVADAIVWQSRITAPACERLREAGLEPLFLERTGLPLDAYFSGPKIAHILDDDPAAGLRRRAEGGELAFGTVDSFLVWRLTGGRAHVTDVSNASRTLLFDIGRLAWDQELLGHVGVPAAVLPSVVPSASIVGETEPSIFGRAIPIAGIAGDQQAALFGQACLEPGDAKVTFGTGAFLLCNAGTVVPRSRHGLLATVAWQLGPGGPATYAIEGSVFVAGAAVGWLRDGLGLIEDADGFEALAGSVPDADGVVVVPAFTGLGAPHWAPDARGTILGLTRGSGPGHIARATLDAIALQVNDVVEAVTADLGTPLERLRVDGGAASNDLLMQTLADLTGIVVERPEVTETTALGAARLAALAVGMASAGAGPGHAWRLERRFEPTLDDGARAARLAAWRRAVDTVLDWSRRA